MRCARFRSTVEVAAIVAIGCVAASCGGESDPATVGAKRPPAADASASRSRDRAGTLDTDAQVDVDALLAAWLAATKADTGDPDAVEALVRGGQPVLDRLAGWIRNGTEDQRNDAAYLIPKFGATAFPVLIELLSSPDADARRAAMDAASQFSGDAFRGHAAEALCRALLARIDDATDRHAAFQALDCIGPAAGCVAADVATWWLSAEPDPKFERAGWARTFCVSLGINAAPAAPVIVRALRAAADAGADPPDEAFRALSAIGTADPSILGDLRSLLRGGPASLRAGVCDLLGTWGDAAAPAIPEFTALLTAEDEWLRAAAAGALAEAGPLPDATVDALIAAFTADGASLVSGHRNQVVASFMGHPGFEARLLAAVGALPADQRADALGSLIPAGVDARQLVPGLLTSDDPWTRRRAIDAFADREQDFAALPIGVAALLDDADAGVRWHAANAFAGKHGVPAARIREITLALLREERVKEYDLYAAMRILAAVAPRDPPAFAALVAALDDPTLIEAAFSALRQGTDTFPGEHPAAIAFAVQRASSDDMWANFLLRLQGGEAALVGALRTQFEQLAEQRELRADDSYAAVVALGMRAESLQPLLLRVRERAPKENSPTWNLLECAIAASGGDADAFALHASLEEGDVRALLAMGAPGRRGVVLLVGNREWDIYRCVEELPAWLGDVSLRDEILAAGRAESPEPHATELRLGAVQLAWLLPPDDARRLVVPLAGAPSPNLGQHIVWSLRVLEMRSPGALGATAVAPFLVDASEARIGAVRLAGLLGPRGENLVAALRVIRDRSSDDEMLAPAVALWRITRRTQEATPTLRALLARGRLPGNGWDHSDIEGAADALGHAGVTAADVPDLARAVVKSSTYAGPLVALLARLGPAAAPAVPALRQALGARDFNKSTGEPTRQPESVHALGRTVAQTLAAIGPAARPVIPDLRLRIADLGDPDGVIRDAIRKIEAAPPR